jgi:hypothetical protein
MRTRTTTVENRVPNAPPLPISTWRPFQVTHSERRPVIPANRTLFNLVPCNRELEVAVANFIDRCSDLAAFAKNAGPQSLRIDYLAAGSRLAFYTPDFFVRSNEGHCYLIETKGREDKNVPRKAKAAIAWCEAASSATSRNRGTCLQLRGCFCQRLQSRDPFNQVSPCFLRVGNFFFLMRDVHCDRGDRIGCGFAAVHESVFGCCAISTVQCLILRDERTRHG